jgi:hypothetical protein
MLNAKSHPHLTPTLSPPSEGVERENIVHPMGEGQGAEMVKSVQPPAFI